MHVPMDAQAPCGGVDNDPVRGWQPLVRVRMTGRDTRRYYTAGYAGQLGNVLA